jgi:Virulence factor
VTEYQVTRWRELPAMVVARAGDETVKAELASRFQEAIDEAAMRLGDTGAEDYLDGWERSPWAASDGTPAEALDRVAAELDEAWPADRIAAYLDGLGRGGSG